MREKTEKENLLELEKRINKSSTENYIKLVNWLYSNHKDILREWEATQGDLRVEFV